MFAFGKKSTASPSMTRQLNNLPSTPYLPDEESMPTPTYEQPHDGSTFRGYKKAIIGITSLAIVGTVAALALYHPEANTKNTSVGSSAEEKPYQPNAELAAELDSLTIHNIPYIREAPGQAPSEHHSKELELELLKAKHDAEANPSHRAALGKKLELLQAKGNIGKVAEVGAPKRPALEKYLELVAAKKNAEHAETSHRDILGKKLELIKALNSEKAAEIEESVDEAPESDDVIRPSLEKYLELVKAKDNAAKSSPDHRAALGKRLELLQSKANAAKVADIGSPETAERPALEKYLELLAAKNNGAKALTHRDALGKKLELLQSKANAAKVGDIENDEEAQGPTRDEMELILIHLAAKAQKVPYIVD